MAVRGLGERREVAGRILRGAERAAGHAARRVVDPGHQRRERQIPSEPAVAAAVDLEQHPLLWHPLPAAPVPRGAAGPDRPDRRLGEDPPERPRGDDESLALGEQLSEKGPVHPVVRRRREFDQARTQGLVEPVGWCPPTVAVGEVGWTIGVTAEEAADLAG